MICASEIMAGSVADDTIANYPDEHTTGVISTGPIIAMKGESLLVYDDVHAGYESPAKLPAILAAVVQRARELGLCTAAEAAQVCEWGTCFPHACEPAKDMTATLENLSADSLEDKNNIWRFVSLIATVDLGGIELLEISVFGVVNGAFNTRGDAYLPNDGVLGELAKKATGSYLQGLAMSQLSGAILVAQIAAKTPATFAESVRRVHEFKHPQLGIPCGNVHPNLLKALERWPREIEELLIEGQTFNRGMTGLQVAVTEKSYLNTTDQVLVEAIGMDLMRVVLTVLGGDTDAPDFSVIREYFLCFRQLKIQSASPTRSNIGRKHASGTSCYVDKLDDSMVGINQLYSRCANGSKSGGGIGFSISGLREEGAYIVGNNGRADGWISCLKTFESLCRYANQKGTKRKGAFSFYFPDYAISSLECIKNNIDDENAESRCHDMRAGLLTHDLLWARLEKGEKWTLFRTSVTGNLHLQWGQEWEEHYLHLERTVDPKFTKVVDAKSYMREIIGCCNLSAGPYVINIDEFNRRNPSDHGAMVHCSNLCTEIALPFGMLKIPDPVTGKREHETASCNLGQVVVTNHILRDPLTHAVVGFDAAGFCKSARLVTRFTDHVLNVTEPPTPEVARGMRNWRNLGIGVCGLRDTMGQLKIAIKSERSCAFSLMISELLTFSVMSESAAMAEEFGTYPLYPGSRFDRAAKKEPGVVMFRHELNNPLKCARAAQLRKMYPETAKLVDWEALRAQITRTGLRNAQHTAIMPTATTGMAAGTTASYESPLSIVQMRVMLGMERPEVPSGLWDLIRSLDVDPVDIMSRIMSNNGRLTRWELYEDMLTGKIRSRKLLLKGIPEELLAYYPSAADLDPFVHLRLAADIDHFVTQATSFSHTIPEERFHGITDAASARRRLIQRLFVAANKEGMATISYYMRVTKPGNQRDLDKRLREMKASLDSYKDPVVSGPESKFPAHEGPAPEDSAELANAQTTHSVVKPPDTISCRLTAEAPGDICTACE
jgi:ribonucleoside-diphosphate reductase alpha subunit